MNPRGDSCGKRIEFPKTIFYILLASNLLGFVCACQRIGQNKDSAPAASRKTKTGSPHPLVASSPPTAEEPLAASPDNLPVDFDPISDVLGADLSPGETSTRLLTFLANTPEDVRPFLIQLAGNYCPDKEYWRLLPFLLERSLPEDCREELMWDLLRRPDPIRLRPLYRLALDSTHPLSQEAKEYLFSYLQEVPENDLQALARAVERAEKNRDEDRKNALPEM